jgi:tetratricopeptide (TPR) repeat protein
VKHSAAVLLLSMLLVSCLNVGAQSLPAAKADARLGKVDAAIADLFNTPKTAETHALLCSLYGSIEKRDEAIRECEAASAAAPNSSAYALDLARAYGAKADESGALTGIRMVSKVRGSFERAVQLDPNNIEALSDLGEFYVEAPGIVGGGTDKARALVTRLQPLSPARAHRLAGMIASKVKDDKTAEGELTAEVAMAHTPEAYVDLANFYRNHKQPDRAAEQAKLAISRDTHHDSDSLDAAAILFDLKLDTKVAHDALRAYLQTPQTGVAAYAHAHVMLGDSLRAAGDNAGAQKEYAAALALAHDYEPARKGAAQ